MYVFAKWNIQCAAYARLFLLGIARLRLSLQAVNVLMEGTPVGLDVAVLQSDLVSLRGVLEVHDLHVWSISIGRPALACHLVVCRRRLLLQLLLNTCDFVFVL